VWNLVRRAFPSDNRKPLIELPEELWKGNLPTGDYHLEEERRLFYVALTRARESLTLVTVANERRKPSPFVDDLREAPPVDLSWVRPIVSAEPRREQSPEPQDPPPLGITPRRDDSKPLTLSISQLETYLDCPLRYYFSYVLAIPVPHAPAMLFGTAMHAAARAVLQHVCGERRALSDAQIEAILNEHWKERNFDDPVQERKYREQGIEQLKQLRDAWKDRPVKLLHQEKPFAIQLGGVPVAGRIDLVYRNEQDEVELLDFKTGSPKSQKDADEMRQLTLYAEACRRELGLKAQAIALYNLTGNELLHTSRGDADLKDLEAEIQDTAQSIAAGSFPAHPGYMSCRYCSYRAICQRQEQRAD
jgi:DNA helicase-2/ATP-dependent DNA helicase PcrA